MVDNTGMRPSSPFETGFEVLRKGAVDFVKIKQSSISPSRPRVEVPAPTSFQESYTSQLRNAKIKLFNLNVKQTSSDFGLTFGVTPTARVGGGGIGQQGVTTQSEFISPSTANIKTTPITTEINEIGARSLTGGASLFGATSGTGSDTGAGSTPDSTPDTSPGTDTTPSPIRERGTPGFPRPRLPIVDVPGGFTFNYPPPSKLPFGGFGSGRGFGYRLPKTKPSYKPTVYAATFGFKSNKKVQKKAFSGFELREVRPIAKKDQYRSLVRGFTF
jgi:hypothetical protein